MKSSSEQEETLLKDLFGGFYLFPGGRPTPASKTSAWFLAEDEASRRERAKPETKFKVCRQREEGGEKKNPGERMEEITMPGQRAAGQQQKSLCPGGL